MLKFFKNFFHLSNTELKGALMLLFFIFSIFITPRIYYFFKQPEDVKDIEFENWIAEINRKEDSIQNFLVKNKNENFSTNKKIEIEYFNFDPNTVSFEEMQKLGLDDKTARILLKFREKGAKFYNKKDVLKIYGFEEELYDKLANYIQFPKKKSYPKKDKFAKEEVVVEYFPFDPNEVSYDDLLKLGLSSKTAAILIKFRGDKTVFYSKEDVLKVYGFTEEVYAPLANYIIFPESKSFVNDTVSKDKENYAELVVEINSANAETFQKLKGIGPYFSKEIISYRNKLGGYYSTEQLKEVYGIKEELFVEIEAKLQLDKTKIIKIDLNKAGFKELIKHPYIDKEITLAILKLKKEIGDFNKVEDLIYYDTLEKEDFDRIKEYLEVK